MHTATVQCLKWSTWACLFIRQEATEPALKACCIRHASNNFQPVGKAGHVCAKRVSNSLPWSPILAQPGTDHSYPHWNLDTEAPEGWSLHFLSLRRGKRDTYSTSAAMESAQNEFGVCPRHVMNRNNDRCISVFRQDLAVYSHMPPRIWPATLGCQRRATLCQDISPALWWAPQPWIPLQLQKKFAQFWCCSTKMFILSMALSTALLNCFKKASLVLELKDLSWNCTNSCWHIHVW